VGTWRKRALSGLFAAALLVFCVLGAGIRGTGEPADGIYTPGRFYFTGGTGRVSITCPKVEVREGQAYATLVFDSGSYSYVKVGDAAFQGRNTEDSSTFEIPVRLNEENQVIGCTTRMSSLHEIIYDVFVSADGADNALGESTAGVGMDTAREAEATSGEHAEATSGESGKDPAASAGFRGAPKLRGLTCESQVIPEYAEGFRIYHYSGGFTVIEVRGSLSYLAVPEGKEVPEGLPDGMVVLKKPLDHIYVAGTATMALFAALDGLDAVAYSSLKADGWYVDGAKEAMEAGRIRYAGKYSEPDYEMLAEEGCGLAVESQMIHHVPKVSEMLERMGIPVLIDCSSNEGHPLGRTEWIRVYGVLLDKEEEAEAFFEEQAKILEELRGIENTGQSVVYFYMNSNGQAVVRTGTDYMTKMIEIAGGRYPFESLADESGSTAVISMEEFYAAAADADYLIYNASIDDRLRSVEELTAKDEILKNIRAVKEGNVFCTDKDFYQATDIAARMISDIHIMLTDGDEGGMTFLYRVEE